MKRATRLVAMSGLLGITPFLIAQERQPALPSDILGAQLIAWSHQQKPQPVPKPLPGPPDQHEQQPKQSASQHPKMQPDVQTFTGRILRDRNRYVLQVSNDDVYQLDDQETAETFEGKDVKLVGALDESTRSIRVTSIRFPEFEDYKCRVRQAASPEGGCTFTVSGLPCAGRWISCCLVGLRLGGKAASSAAAPDWTDL